MKGIALLFGLFYLGLWCYAVYYSCTLLYQLVGEKAVPLFWMIGILYLLKVIANGLTSD